MTQLMTLVRTLIDHEQKTSRPSLTRDLQESYDGDLQFPEVDNSPYVIANFVSTLDGVVSYKIPGHAGGSTISRADQADRFIMGLLRASVDAVMVGSVTVHDVNPETLWTPEYAYPAAARLYADYRLTLHKDTYPLVVIVSGSGQLDLKRAIFRTPAVRTAVITTSAGRDELIKAGITALHSVEIHALDARGRRIDPDAIMQLLWGLGIRRLLHEGGPKLFGAFLSHDALNELFLTLSPQVAGRGERTIRPALIEGAEFLPDSAPGFELVSVKQRADDLFLRYRRRMPSTRAAM
jgi:riboflavin biosynthesis pyrimidine reductase